MNMEQGLISSTWAERVDAPPVEGLLIRVLASAPIAERRFNGLMSVVRWLLRFLVPFSVTSDANNKLLSLAIPQWSIEIFKDSVYFLLGNVEYPIVWRELFLSQELGQAVLESCPAC